MKRRKFLFKSIATTVSSLFIGKNLASNTVSFVEPPILGDDKKVYITESGIYGKDAFFALGFLVLETADSEKTETIINNYRTLFGYTTKLTYSSNDKHRTPFAKELIKFFVQNKELSFYILPIEFGKNDAESGLDHASFKKRAMGKMEYYTTLSSIIGATEQTRFLTKSQSPFGPSAYYQKAFKENVVNADFSAINTTDSNLLQLSGLLTGCIRNALKPSTASKTKNDLIEHLKKQLEVTDITTGSNIWGKVRIL